MHRNLLPILKIASVVIVSLWPPQSATASTPSLERTWKRLIATEACLMGGEYCFPGKDGKRICAIDRPEIKRDGCCFYKGEWRKFLSSEPKALGTFLLSRIRSTGPTQVHACPFDLTIEGELAVYCLQHLLRVNWFELSPGYGRYAKDPGQENLQEPLQQIVRSKGKVRKLIALWRKRILKSKSAPKNSSTRGSRRSR